MITTEKEKTLFVTEVKGPARLFYCYLFLSFFLSTVTSFNRKKNNNIFFSQFFLFLILLRSFPSGFLLSHPYSCYDLSARKEFSHVSFQSSPLNKDKFVQPGVTCLLPIELVFTPTKSLEKGKIISKAK